ncbi:MAG: flagellar motor switch protein FliN [Halieaceae bacterium]|jgi:flagellar motor switch protein FliN/FliY|nr:flagellar motor switch protein FliN [Halieaceae bacterium]
MADEENTESTEDVVEAEAGSESAAAVAPEELSSAAPAPASPGEPGGGRIDLDMLMDVQVSLSVELGRARIAIKDLIALNQGSIVSLERDVNEPLDLMVNGTLIARGEVVEADGQFGLRLIDVVSPGERLQKLK